MAAPPKEIALLRLSAMGDLVMMLPLIRAIQEQLPDARITWITGDTFFPLIEDISGVDFVVVKKPRTLAGFIAFGRTMAKRRFDVLLATQASFRANFLYPFIRASKKIGFDPSHARDWHRLFIDKSIHRDPKKRHIVDGFFAFLGPLGLSQEVEKRWDLPVDPLAKDWSEEMFPKGPPLLVVHPSASKPERNWSAQSYAEVINRAHQEWGVKAVITGGAACDEIELGNQIHDLTGEKATLLVGKTGLKQLCALLARADVVVAPDTGVIHIASALNTPVIGLYAVAPSELAGPYNHPHLVVDRYMKANGGFVDPSSPSRIKRIRQGSPMSLITVEDVLEKLETLFLNHNSQTNIS